MFAIQNGNKFLKVEYFIDPDKVYNVTVSATAKLYKTQAQAKQDLERAQVWLEQKAQRAQEVITANESFVVKNTKSLERLESKLEGLMLLPFREAERQVKNTRSSIERAQREISSSKPTIRSFRQDLARYERILKAGLTVARVEQTVETL